MLILVIFLSLSSVTLKFLLNTCAFHEYPGEATKPAIFLKLMQQQNHKVEQQNKSDGIQVTQDGPQNRYDHERKTDTVPIPTNKTA